MDWALEDNFVDGLFFCATLTGRRGGRTPFVQAGAETSDTGAESDSRCSWEAHAGRVGAGVGESAKSHTVDQPLRMPLAIRPVLRTYIIVK